MGLEQQLAAFKTEFARTAPAGRSALYEAKIEELRASFAMEAAIGVGDQAPDFVLPDAQGKMLSLAHLLGAGPAVVTFYRGGWCPYCNIQLRAYQAALPEMIALGARLVAISPQLPRRLAIDRGNERTDLRCPQRRRQHRRAPFRPRLRTGRGAAGGAAIEQQGVCPASTATTAGSCQSRRPTSSPATAGVALAAIDVDYRNRLEPEAILAALKSLRPA